MNPSAKSPSPSHSPAGNRPPQLPPDLVNRLPAEVREKISRGLKNGEPPASLANRINSLLEVRQFMALHYASQRLAEVHLSIWGQTGHRDWLDIAAIEEKAQEIVAQSPTSPVEHALQQAAVRYAAASFLLDERGSDLALEKRIKAMERTLKNLLAVIRQPQQETRLLLQKMKLELEAEKLRRIAVLTPDRSAAKSESAASLPTPNLTADTPRPTSPPPPPETVAAPEPADAAPNLAPTAQAPESTPERDSSPTAQPTASPAPAAPLDKPLRPAQLTPRLADNPYRVGLRY